MCVCVCVCGEERRRYRRAQLALQKGDEELAKEALVRRKSFQENADSLMSQFASQKEATEKLMSNTKLLETKLAEAKAKKVSNCPAASPRRSAFSSLICRARA